jgi:hypothetical protein
MKSVENLPRAQDRAPAFAVVSVNSEDLRYSIRGDVSITLRDASTGQVQLEQQLPNIVVKDASILIARLMKNNKENGLSGIVALAVGSGDSGWNLQNPPIATTSQRALVSERARKTFSDTQFIDGAGLPANRPTNVVDFTTTFAESEAVGPLVEMALLGGNISTNMSERKPVPQGAYDPTVNLTNYDTMVNSLRFPVINKPATSTLTITWRLTF